jgi:hypothetical protein
MGFSLLFEWSRNDAQANVIPAKETGVTLLAVTPAF